MNCSSHRTSLSTRTQNHNIIQVFFRLFSYRNLFCKSPNFRFNFPSPPHQIHCLGRTTGRPLKAPTGSGKRKFSEVLQKDTRNEVMSRQGILQYARYRLQKVDLLAQFKREIRLYWYAPFISALAYLPYEWCPPLSHNLFSSLLTLFW